jgi:hypothetical protein
MTDTSFAATPRHSILSRLAYGTTASLIAAVLGASAGALMARIAPPDEYLWLGLMLAPIWFALEVVFESYIEVVGYSSRISRIFASVALLVGFYVSWFLLRP